MVSIILVSLMSSLRCEDETVDVALTSAALKSKSAHY
jgi:hypothetical protein